MKPPIRYYGGKVKQAEWILAVLRMYEFHTYVEPFGGSGAILFAKPQSKVEVYNDLHTDLVTMYRVIKLPATFKEFVYFIEHSPYAKEIFDESKCKLQTNTSMSDVERSGYFFIINRQSFIGCGGCTWSPCGKSGTQQAIPYRNAIDRLPEIHDRLRNVHIENIDAIECISRYASDSPRMTLIYCDVCNTRMEKDSYVHELTDEQHKILVETLLSVPGHKILSGYKTPIYQPLLDAGWTCLEKEFVNSVAGIKARRTECLYCSPTGQSKVKMKMNFSIFNTTIQHKQRN